MRSLFFTIFLLCLTLPLVAQEPTDPAFDPPVPAGDAYGGKVRWNGTIGMVIINGKVYQQFGMRPDIPIGRFGIGLDLTFRFDAEGNFKENEWDDGRDYFEKLYYLRYGLPGDPFYLRLGALDNVTLGYGIIMKRYSNTIQYPDIKRIGLYSEGGYQRIGWQSVINNLPEMDEPGLMAARVSFDTGLKGLTLGAALAHDGNQFAGIQDADDDGVPDRLDLFADDNDFARRDQLMNLLTPAQADSLIRWGLLPDFRRRPPDYKDLKESVTEMGVDAGFPLISGSRFSLWTYAQAAQIVDFGWGWAFPGLRSVYGPIEVGLEYRRYGREFKGEFFNYAYEIERVELVRDSIYQTKERTLLGLGSARGYYADLMATIAPYGYLYGWYADMRGEDYDALRTVYAEAGATPPMLPRLQKVAGYYMQPDVPRVFERLTDGTIYGGKVYLSLATNVSLVYDHRVTYYGGRSHRTVRVETMVTF